MMTRVELMKHYVDTSPEVDPEPLVPAGKLRTFPFDPVDSRVRLLDRHPNNPRAFAIDVVNELGARAVANALVMFDDVHGRPATADEACVVPYISEACRAWPQMIVEADRRLARGESPRAVVEHAYGVIPPKIAEKFDRLERGR
jgi:hypothetical protein